MHVSSNNKVSYILMDYYSDSNSLSELVSSEDFIKSMGTPIPSVADSDEHVEVTPMSLCGDDRAIAEDLSIGLNPGMIQTLAEAQKNLAKKGTVQ